MPVELAMTALSDYWTIEYHFFGNCFSVSVLGDYLTHSQKAFQEHRFWDSVILAIHPTEQGARDECSVWQDRRNKNPMNALRQLEQILPYVEGVKSQLDVNNL